MSAAVVLEAGEGKRFQARGSVMVFKATTTDTGGAFSLMERDLPVRGEAPPPHRHPGAEGFFILSGTIDFSIEGESIPVGPGGFVLVPKGAAHTFSNGSDVAARLLIIHSPAADGYFEELDRLWAGAAAPSAEEAGALMRRHGMEPA